MSYFIQDMLPFSQIISYSTKFILGLYESFPNEFCKITVDYPHKDYELGTIKHSEFNSIDIDIPSGYTLLERKYQLGVCNSDNFWRLEISESEPLYFEKKEIEKKFISLY